MKKIIMMMLSINAYNFMYAQSQKDINNNDIITDKQFLNNKVEWGVLAGWNYDNLYGKEINFVFNKNKTQFQSGFHAGIYVETKLSKHFGLKHELIFRQKKVGVPLSDINLGDYSSTLTMSYLDLSPASLVFQTDNFKIYGGIYASALLNANLQYKDENGKIFKDNNIFGNSENDETKTYYLQKFDFGANIGFDYFLDLGISIGARYTNGFTDIFQSANSYANNSSKTNNIKIYNKGFMLSLGYVFGNSKR